MNENEFKMRFKAAACFCRDFTQKHIVEELPLSLRFNFGLGCRSQVLDDRKFVFAGGSYRNSELTGLSPREAFSFLYKFGEVPYWVDLYVAGFDAEHTYLETVFGEEFTGDESLLFNQNQGLSPFHVIGPTLPGHGWRSLQEDGRFPFTLFS